MPRLEQKLVQKQTLTPQQILQASLLQLNTINLEEKILEELETNPVLEETEREEQELEGDDPDSNGETAEEPSSDEPSQNGDDALDTMDDDDEYEPANIYDNSKDDLDLPIPEQPDFFETLIDQLDLYDLSDSDREIAEEIIWNLDGHGYLETDLVLIADRFEVSENKVGSVLDIIQDLDPHGIGARDLRECLLLQLQDQNESLAYQIIYNHFEDFSHKRYEVILKKTGCSRDELATAVEHISHLNPRPGEGVSTGREDVVIPDLIVREMDGKWVIYVNDSGIPELQVSPDYLAMMEEPGRTPNDTRKYLKEKIDSANWFIQAIRQRRQTLRRVMKVIIERQPNFFQGNIHQLRPMKLQDVADEIDMDISTISRSTRGKYVDTPYGVFELKSFFTEGMTFDDGRTVSNHQIKQVLKKVVEEENKQHPFNDEQLVQKMKERGYPVARRTVAKYREQLAIPVARLRREI